MDWDIIPPPSRIEPFPEQVRTDIESFRLVLEKIQLARASE